MTIIGTIWRIAKILKVKVDDLLEEMPDPQEDEEED